MADKSLDKETVIAAGTRIVGGVRGEEDLTVKGRIDGHIELTETLTIEPGGVVQAQIEVKSLIVNGVLVGNARASGSIRLGEKARVVGDLSAPRITVAAGAAFRGKIEMGEGGARPADKQQVADQAASAGAAAIKLPPRLAPPSRAGAAPTATLLAPRVATAPPTRSSGPPSLPRPDAVGVASAPAWSKKKQLRRR